jgi:hypothetical protein
MEDVLIKIALVVVVILLVSSHIDDMINMSSIDDEDFNNDR